MDIELLQCAHCHRINGSVVYHHIYGRRYSHIIDHPLNKLPLCYLCHVESSSFSAHRTPKLFIQWLEEFYGEEKMDELRHLAHHLA